MNKKLLLTLLLLGSTSIVVGAQGGDRPTRSKSEPAQSLKKPQPRPPRIGAFNFVGHDRKAAPPFSASVPRQRSRSARRYSDPSPKSGDNKSVGSASGAEMVRTPQPPASRRTNPATPRRTSRSKNRPSSPLKPVTADSLLAAAALSTDALVEVTTVKAPAKPRTPKNPWATPQLGGLPRRGSHAAAADRRPKNPWATPELGGLPRRGSHAAAADQRPKERKAQQNEAEEKRKQELRKKRSNRRQIEHLLTQIFLSLNPTRKDEVLDELPELMELDEEIQSLQRKIQFRPQEEAIAFLQGVLEAKSSLALEQERRAKPVRSSDPSPLLRSSLASSLPSSTSDSGRETPKSPARFSPVPGAEVSQVVFFESNDRTAAIRYVVSPSGAILKDSQGRPVPREWYKKLLEQQAAKKASQKQQKTDGRSSATF